MITRARKFFNKYYSLREQIRRLESHPKIDKKYLGQETEINPPEQKRNKFRAGNYIMRLKQIKHSAKVLTKFNNPWLYIPNQYNSNLSIKQELNNLEKKQNLF